MPISQQRMIAVLEEAERLERWASSLRRDLLTLLGGSDMGPEAKIEAAQALVDISTVPTCVAIAIERDHFKRTERRNIRTAERMRIRRARENHHDNG